MCEIKLKTYENKYIIIIFYINKNIYKYIIKIYMLYDVDLKNLYK